MNSAVSLFERSDSATCCGAVLPFLDRMLARSDRSRCWARPLGVCATCALGGRLRSMGRVRPNRLVAAAGVAAVVWLGLGVLGLADLRRRAAKRS